MANYESEQTVTLYEDIGLRMRWERRRRELSQTRMAEKLGWKQSILGSYERGERRISIDKLLQFAEWANMPIEYFIEGRNNRTYSDATRFQTAGKGK